MKKELKNIADHLDRDIITEQEARTLLLGLFGVSGSLQPLTVQRVDKMMQECSKDTWKAVQGDEHGWKEWWSDRNKLYLNSNDH
ncbi:MAG TPA: hypothetical protein DDX98_01190 [Bacteroidales bacterium]|jgi:hypothetical protein|nr:hypothetical protein [Bacteroidales bacterium]